MYKPTARDLLGSHLDAFRFHPFTDKLRMTRLKLWWWRHFRRRRYETLKRINLGCGPNLFEGMCNVDVSGGADLHFNFLNRFPLPDAVSDFVYCEHALEHFHIDHAQHILKEIVRILRPGGSFRISVPKVLLSQESGSEERIWSIDALAGPALIELNRRLYGHEHKTLYSVALLEHLCREAGAAQVRAVREGESFFSDAALIQRIEHRRAGNLVVEARKGM